MRQVGMRLLGWRLGWRMVGKGGLLGDALLDLLGRRRSWTEGLGLGLIEMF